MKAFYQIVLLPMLVAITTCISKAPKDKSQILIVDGFSNHDWKKTTQIIQRLLKTEAEIELTVATVPAMDHPNWGSWKPQFKQFDVVIQNTNDINNGSKWPLAAKKSFEKYMYEGGAMVVFHSANNAFPNWQEYNKMIGLGWRKKSFGKAVMIHDDYVHYVSPGEGENTGHGKRRDVLVHKLTSHPINSSYPDTWRAADLEVYRYARGPAENLSVLSYPNFPHLES